MGAYVSREGCLAHYGVDIRCDTLPANGSRIEQIGPYRRGQWPTDPDIAGIGVLGAFLAVTVASLVLSVLSMAWWWAKNILHVKKKFREEEKAVRPGAISVTAIFEVLVITCSDQQIFTGGAYAITLRYVTGCQISAYHYNIVANMLLITCATHLMAITVTRNYWEHAVLGVIRVVVTSLIFLVTGMLLSNQSAAGAGFPTQIPPADHDYSDMLLNAACFQSGEGGFTNSVQQSLSTGGNFFDSRIPGWSQFLVMLFFYIAAVLMRCGRVVRAGRNKGGRRARLVGWTKKTFSLLYTPSAQWILRLVYGIYLVVGVTISGWTVGTSSYYVFALRDWVDKSGWIERSGNLNPENDPWSFGQLVPLLLMSLTLYTFIQVISEQVEARRTRRKAWKRRDQEAQELAAAAAAAAAGSRDSDNKEMVVEETEKSAYDRPSDKPASDPAPPQPSTSSS
ncbi:TRP C-terminal domain-containing protein [Madurella fahalii]|uniref:TRP C-terminal domain-containing protein n=1 Tax=Madurella fahalii TaxID=1157608 RepID=A0ABQ0GJM5_9PEZI